MNESTLDQKAQSTIKDNPSPWAKYYPRMRPRDREAAESLENARAAALERDDEYRVEQIEALMMRLFERYFNVIFGSDFGTT